MAPVAGHNFGLSSLVTPGSGERMVDVGDAGEAVCAALRFMLEASHLSGPTDLPALTREAGAILGAAEAVLYVVDYDQVLLVPMRDDESPAYTPLLVEGTLAGRSFSRIRPVQAEHAGQARAWFPILDGAERLGVLELSFTGPPQAVDGQLSDDQMSDGQQVAAMLAELLLTRARYGDGIEQARRRLPMSLAAELQWTLLPPLTFATPHVAISGILAPTHSVAGDSFDYSVNGGTAHLAILDAMGHGLEALLLSSVAVGALRNARRLGLDLLDTTRSIDKYLAAQFGEAKFVTGVIAELDISTGVYRWINCGHPHALLMRDRRVVKSLEQVSALPLGLLDDKPAIGEERLQRGDRILLYTDGVVEARNAEGEFFGLRRLVDLVVREAAAGRPAPETLRRLNLAILNHQEGELQDDATTLMVEWSGTEPQRITGG